MVIYRNKQNNLHSKKDALDKLGGRGSDATVGRDCGISPGLTGGAGLWYIT